MPAAHFERRSACARARCRDTENELKEKITAMSSQLEQSVGGKAEEVPRRC